MKQYIHQRTLIMSTLFLTATGFLSRILGFFYRIYLSRTIGAEGMGIYQMIFPVYGICFSLCAGSIQTAISRFTAAEKSKGKQALLAGFCVSFSMSLVLAGLIWSQADVIAVHILREPRCAELFPALALAIPCTAVHACICGYYYGKEKVQVPAVSQLIEQCIRIFTVYIVADIFYAREVEMTALVAVIGLVVGEAGSALFALLSFCIFQASGVSFHENLQESATLSQISTPADSSLQSTTPLTSVAQHKHTLPTHTTSSVFSTLIPLMTLATPLMANRLIMNLMQSAEAILIPNQLKVFGLDNSQAVSIYGVLTGMAMPFIMFPSAIINSLAVVLLPTVARQQSFGNHAGIKNSISMSFRYSLYMGVLCIGIFTEFGPELGMTVFDNSDAGTFITILAWLCPFLYLATTMGSILNGLGKTTATFTNNFITITIRLLFVFFGIPRFGILACLWGMLASEIFLVLLHYVSIYRLLNFTPNVWETILKPTFCLLSALAIYQLLPAELPWPQTLGFISEQIQTLLFLGFRIIFVGIVYCLLLLLFHKKKE